jgi:hypothetical protein
MANSRRSSVVGFSRLSDRLPEVSLSGRHETPVPPGCRRLPYDLMESKLISRTAFDPEPLLRIGLMNGREARESGR